MVLVHANGISNGGHSLATMLGFEFQQDRECNARQRTAKDMTIFRREVQCLLLTLADLPPNNLIQQTKDQNAQHTLLTILSIALEPEYDRRPTCYLLKEYVGGRRYGLNATEWLLSLRTSLGHPKADRADRLGRANRLELKTARGISSLPKADGTDIWFEDATFAEKTIVLDGAIGALAGEQLGIEFMLLSNMPSKSQYGFKLSTSCEQLNCSKATCRHMMLLVSAKCI
ncbi:hypothetical protein K474DRAFT_1670833 [Panus rudis PR-1116 ss-1]|nr:hypothetical protein K474DRAFT_1670833 [Panus rudis PR-1116 ss-1]